MCRDETWGNDYDHRKAVRRLRMDKSWQPHVPIKDGLAGATKYKVRQTVFIVRTPSFSPTGIEKVTITIKIMSQSAPLPQPQMMTQTDAAPKVWVLSSLTKQPAWIDCPHCIKRTMTRVERPKSQAT